MIGINDGAILFISLFLLYFNPNSSVLCSPTLNGAKELGSEYTHKFCEVPTLSPHTNVNYKCNECIKNQSTSCVSNGTVAESTVIKISCDPGYSINGKEELLSVCKDNEWTPHIRGCNYCGQIKPTSSNNWGMPWDVAVAQAQDDGKICFGTIISPRVILTSEFCIRTDNTGVYSYTSINQNPLNPETFVVAMVNDLHFEKETWMDRLKNTLSKLNPFGKDKRPPLLKVKEFRSFNRGNKLDKSFFHDILIVIMEKEINFNSYVYPACVQWENPNRVNIKTGTAKVQRFNPNAGGYRYNDYSILSHDACQENPSYPYFVYNWVTILYGFDKGNRNKSDITAFKFSSNKVNRTAIHEGKLFCLELKQDQLDDSLTLIGSGVMLKEEHRYFIRGVAGERFLRDPSHNDTDFNRFMKEIQYIAGISYENFSKNISDAIISGSFDSEYVDETVYLYNYNVTALLRNHLKAVGTGLQIRPDVLVTVTDIADYVDEIKRIVAEVDPYYIS